MMEDCLLQMISYADGELILGSILNQLSTINSAYFLFQPLTEIC